MTRIRITSSASASAIESCDTSPPLLTSRAAYSERAMEIVPYVVLPPSLVKVDGRSAHPAQYGRRIPAGIRFAPRRRGEPDDQFCADASGQPSENVVAPMLAPSR
jgi:hypothetical protein